VVTKALLSPTTAVTGYTLGFVESLRGIHQGDSIMQVRSSKRFCLCILIYLRKSYPVLLVTTMSQCAQVGVGSGIKCGVNVWVALRDIQEEVHDAWMHRVPLGSRQMKRDGTWHRMAPQQVGTGAQGYWRGGDVYALFGFYRLVK